MKNLVVLLSLLIVFSGCIYETMSAFGMYNTPKQCTQTGGKLLIKDFDFNSTNILLQIQNTYPNSVKVTGFEGTPFSIVWENAQESVLERTDSRLFIMRGRFEGNITEEILIYYTVNGLEKQEKTTCSGPV